jgi:5-formyltetrahydrofolate cyclo-ligase
VPDPADPRTTLARHARRELRRRMRALRQALPARAAAERSQRIAARLLELPELQAARGVALFWPIEERREVDLRPIDASLRASGARIHYPFMDETPDGFRTGFRLVTRVAELAERGRMFAEPPPGAPEAARGDLDLVIVPCLAASADGHRLGYGAGFYDATLPDVRPPALALVVAFSFQLISEIPPNDADVACDLVVSDDRVIRV